MGGIVGERRRRRPLRTGGGTDLYVNAADGTQLAFNDSVNGTWCSALDDTIPASTTVYASVWSHDVQAIPEYLLQIDFP